MRLPRLRDIALMFAAWAGAFLICLPFTWRHFYSQLILGYPLRRDIGFSDSSPYTRDPKYFLRAREVVAAGSVKQGSIAARAGLRANDVFLDYSKRDRGATALFLDLERSRGGEFCTSVVRLFESGLLESRPRRRVCFAVPANPS